MSELRQQVFESLNNAIENEYQFSEWTAEEIALDLCEFDAILGVYLPADLLPHVIAWKKEGIKHE